MQGQQRSGAHHRDLIHLQLVGILADSRNDRVVGRHEHKTALRHLVDALLAEILASVARELRTGGKGQSRMSRRVATIYKITSPSQRTFFENSYAASTNAQEGSQCDTE